MDDETKEIIKDLAPGCYHIVPRGDIADHEKAPNCWCQPRCEYRDGKRDVEVWIHRYAREDNN